MEAVSQQTDSSISSAEVNHNTSESMLNTAIAKTIIETTDDCEVSRPSRSSNAAQSDSLNHNDYSRIEADLVQPEISIDLFRISNVSATELQKSNSESMCRQTDDLFDERPRRTSSNSNINDAQKSSQEEPSQLSFPTLSHETENSRVLPHINAFIKDIFNSDGDKWRAERSDMAFASSYPSVENILNRSNYVRDTPTRIDNEYHGSTTAIDVRNEAHFISIQNPKVNGDHAPAHEADTAHHSVIKSLYSFSFSGMNTDNTEAKTNNNLWPSLAREEDEHSRCSSMASSVSCSTATSSSHHLVIDQPMDEMDGTKIAEQAQLGISVSNIVAPPVQPAVNSHGNPRETMHNKPRTKAAKKYIETVAAKKNGKSLRTNTAKLNSASPGSLTITSANNLELPTPPAVNHNLSSSDTAEKIVPAKSYFYCTLCENTHEQWNVFWHIYWKHDRYICVYCFHSYNTAEKLSLHLELKHDRDQRHFSTKQALFDSLKESRDYECESRFFVCCTCQHVFEENDQFSDHVCAEYMKPCAFCDQKGRHSLQCKFHPNAKRPTKVRKKAKERLSPLKAIPSAILGPQESQFPGSHQSLPFQSATPACDNNVQNLTTTGSLNLLPTEPPRHNHNDFNMAPGAASENNTSLLTEQPAGNGSDAVSLDSQNVSMDQTLLVLPPDKQKVVPKIKLCVPKQYQKSVDEALSTSDSDDEEVEDENLDRERTLSMDVEENNSATESATEIALSQEESNGSGKQNLTPDDDSADEPDPKLTRILQDIERTKMDIQRTKECMHHTNAAVKKSGSRTVELIGSPTPPTSPKIQTDSTDHVSHTKIQNEAITVVDNVEHEQRRTDSSANLDILSNSITSGVPNETNELSEAANNSANMDPTKAKENLSYESEQINVDEVEPQVLPADGIEIANDDVIAVELPIADRPLDQYDAIDFVRLCLQTVYPICLYCNHARRIAVNGNSLVLHMLAQHRFTTDVDTTTKAQSTQEIVIKLKSFLNLLEKEYLNSSSYCTLGQGAHTHFFNERIFECFQCRFVGSTHKELYLHNRKVHPKPPILCHMCRGNFYTFSEILCHICQGAPHKTTPLDIKYRCCLCEETNIPSAFRLMVHLRQRHFSCDVCLEDCLDQAKLSQHVWKHKLNHVCYRCGISYRSKLDIAKHLFWKHDTESITCKRCLQKRWRHVYHFCTPPATFVCDDCQMCFSRAMHLRVHKRLHAEDLRHPCLVDACEEKFISRRLLQKHSTQHSARTPNSPAEIKNDDKLAETGTNEGVDPEAKDQKNVNDAELKPEKDEVPAIKDENVTPKAEDPATETGPSEITSIKKKKRKKRSKESLDDLNLLNLPVPNLSETDSSDDSESEEKSKEDLMIPKTICSPVTNDDVLNQDEPPPKEEPDTGLVPAIWKQFFENVEAADYTEDNYPRPNHLHVAVSDHDYCRLYKDNDMPPAPKVMAETAEVKQKRLNSTSTRRSSSSSESSSSSSSSRSSSSTSSSRSSCSSSSSSGSEDSDSSAASNGSGYLKNQKSNRKRSASVSPLKKPSLSERQDNNSTADSEALAAELPTSDARKPLAYNESDLETNESATDEDFYEEHPQKIATDLTELAQKRAQLIARTRLSPSNNYDIVENSRPSTPSLPGDVTFENRVKLKKKKRERKNTVKFSESTAYQASKNVGSENFLTPALHESHSTSQNSMDQAMERFSSHPPGRRSEGSSCSDLDGQLKRSKRQRRPNKFYGYTSDDESMASGLGQNAFFRAFRPPPPPNFTWHKEDLPSPSKRSAKKKALREASEGLALSLGDVLKKKRRLNIDKLGRKRPSKKQKFTSLPPIPPLKIRPLQIGINFGASSSLDGFNIPDSPLNRKTAAEDSSCTTSEDEAPVPLPMHPEQPRPKPTKPPTWRIPPAQSVLPAAPPRPPSPQTTAFNHRIPPALLPNPDFATLQYFKANNIRYPIRPPVGARQAREGESVYCYCRCPYDEVSEMIACDGGNCLIEWFHFECVGIMVAPQGKWFCAECRPKYSEELYPTVAP